MGVKAVKPNKPPLFNLAVKVESRKGVSTTYRERL